MGKRVYIIVALLSTLALEFVPLGGPLLHPASSQIGEGVGGWAWDAARPTPIASYQIQVMLDPAAKAIRGHEVLTYLNASTDALPVLPFHLYLNAFRDRTTTFMRESGGGQLRNDRFDPNYPGWIQVDAARQNDASLPSTFNEDRTVMTLTLPSALAPGASTQIEFDFHAQLPKVFARTGFWEPDFFMVGQWFPKIADYDDRGWHSWPFHANAEFYADFGTYDVDITVPKSFVVGATGTRTQVQEQGELRTETYHAEDVIDFAWTASPHYKTATRRAGNVDITLLYQPENQQYVERYLKATEQSLEAYGQWYGPYVYPRITVVDPPSAASGAGGMEYPMLITAGVGALGIPEPPGGAVREAEVVVLHEMGHEWFYAVVATNEAEEPWLDEGFTDFSAAEAADRYYGVQTSLVDAPGIKLGYRQERRLEYLANPSVPTYGKAWDFQGVFDYEVAAYSKPVVVLTTLKNILGADTFGRVMKTYYERYSFKHPRTEDFIAVAQEVSGRDLKWFFDQTVYGKGVLDYAVESASTRRDGNKYHSAVVLERKGEVKFPVDVSASFADGTQQRQVWDGQAISQTLTFDTRAPLAYAAVDPDLKFAMEVNTTDDSLTVQSQIEPLARLASRWLFWMQTILDLGF
jgi:hypothetical protein